MHRVVSTCSDVSEGVLPTFLGWLTELKWMLNWCSGRKLPSNARERRCGAICWNIGCSKMSERTSQQGVKPNRRTWTTASVTSWPLATLYMCFCACQEIVLIHTKYRTENYFCQPLWSRTNSKFRDRYTASESLRILGKPNKSAPCVHFECGIIKTLTTVFRIHTKM